MGPFLPSSLQFSLVLLWWVGTRFVFDSTGMHRGKVSGVFPAQNNQLVVRRASPLHAHLSSVEPRRPCHVPLCFEAAAGAGQTPAPAGASGPEAIRASRTPPALGRPQFLQAYRASRPCIPFDSGLLALIQDFAEVQCVSKLHACHMFEPVHNSSEGKPRNSTG